jgi:hypothetical protein
MSTIQVSNVIFESTGNNRVQYSGANTYSLFAGGASVLTINTTAIAANGILTAPNFVANSTAVTANLSFVAPNFVANATVVTANLNFVAPNFVANSTAVTANLNFVAPNLTANATQVNVFSVAVNSTSLALPGTYALRVGGTPGTNGQILTSNGSAAFWANAAAGGGSGLFNTSLTSSIGFAANSTLSAAFTAPSTAGLRYIVHSIHVTNIGSANSGVTAKINGSTYANTSLSTTVPLPVESAVELLKMPKVMQPNDVLSIQVQDNTPLHATITYETQTSPNFFGAGVDITADAAFTDLYTATGNAVIQSVLLSNDDGVNDVKARVVWTDGSNNIQGYYCFDLIIPADATVEILEQAKYLPSGFKIRVYANVGNRLEAIVAGRLI